MFLSLEVTHWLVAAARRVLGDVVRGEIGTFCNRGDRGHLVPPILPQGECGAQSFAQAHTDCGSWSTFFWTPALERDRVPEARREIEFRLAR